MATEVLRLGMNTTGFEAGGKRTQATLAGITGAASTTQKVMAGLGITIGATVLGVAVASAISGFIEFDSKLNQSIAIMSDVDATMRAGMIETAREVAVETNIAASSAAESYFFLASAGLDAEQSIAALPAVANFARAGMFDMAQATDLATDAQSALGLAADDAQVNLRNMTRVTDVLVKANTLANASVEQFSTALTSEAGAALKTFGIEIEEGVAVLAAFADQGVKAEKAGNALSRILRLMTSAAVNNAEAYKEHNIQIFDSQGSIRNLADIIQDLEGALGGMSDETRVAALEQLGFQARVQGVLNPLIGTSDAIREYERGLRAAGGTSKEISDNQMLSLENRIGKIRQQFTNWRDELVEKIVPAIELVIDNAGLMGDAIIGLTQAIGIAGFTGAVVLLLPTLVAWNATIGFLITQHTALTVAIAVLRTAIQTFFASLGPAGWLILGVGALATGITIVRRRSRELRDELTAQQTELEKTAAGFSNLTEGMARFVLEGRQIEALRISEKIAQLEEELANQPERAPGRMGNLQGASPEVQELNRQLTEQKAALEETEFLLAEAAKAYTAFGKSAEDAGGGVDTGTQALTEAEQTSKDLIASLGIQVRQQERLLAAAKESQEAYDDTNREIEKENALREALAEATAEDAATVEVLINKLFRLSAATEEVREAEEERLRVEEEAAMARERARENAVDVLEDLDRQIDETRRLIEAQKEGADAIKLVEQAIERERAAMALGEEATKEYKEEVIFLTGVLQKLREEFGDVEAESESLSETLTEPWEQALRSIQQSMSGMFSDLLQGELGSWKDFADDILGIFTDLAAQIASLLVADALGIPQLIEDIRKEGAKALSQEGLFGDSTLGKVGGGIGGAALGGLAGYQSGSPAAGALSGGAAGFALGGPVGGILGAVGGLVGGLIGQAEKAKEAARRFRAARDQWEAGMEEFNRLFEDEPPFLAAMRDLGARTEAEFDRLKGVYAEHFTISFDDLPSLEEIDEILAGSMGPIGGMLEQFWKDARSLAEDAEAAQARAAEREKERLAAISQNLDLEQARLEGDDARARQLEYEIELQDAVKNSWTQAQMAQLETIQGLREQIALEEERAEKLRGRRDFDTTLANALAQSRPDDVDTQIAAKRITGEIEIAQTLEGFAEIAEAVGITDDEMTLLAATLRGNLNDALEEMAEQAMRVERSWRENIELRRLDAAGMDEELRRRRLEIQQRDELEQAMAAGLPDELIRELKELHEIELAAAIKEWAEAAREAEKAAREAAAAERRRQFMAEENLRLRLLQLRGEEEAARELKQQLEILQAVEQGQSASYLALLQQIHAEEDRQAAIEKSTKAVEESTRAAERMSSVLNAPQGIRLSLLRWRAELAGTGIRNPAGGAPVPVSTNSTQTQRLEVLVRAEGDSTQDNKLSQEDVDRITDAIIGKVKLSKKAGGPDPFETFD